MPPGCHPRPTSVMARHAGSASRLRRRNSGNRAQIDVLDGDGKNRTGCGLTGQLLARAGLAGARMRRSGLLNVATGGRAILGCMGEYANRADAARYNYRNFDAWVGALGDLADEAAFAASPSAGQRAPDFTLPR